MPGEILDQIVKLQTAFAPQNPNHRAYANNDPHHFLEVMRNNLWGMVRDQNPRYKLEDWRANSTLLVDLWKIMILDHLRVMAEDLDPMWGKFYPASHKSERRANFSDNPEQSLTFDFRTREVLAFGRFPLRDFRVVNDNLTDLIILESTRNIPAFHRKETLRFNIVYGTIANVTSDVYYHPIPGVRQSRRDTHNLDLSEESYANYLQQIAIQNNQRAS